jgi:hypothetical protein
MYLESSHYVYPMKSSRHFTDTFPSISKHFDGSKAFAKHANRTTDACSALDLPFDCYAEPDLTLHSWSYFDRKHDLAEIKLALFNKKTVSDLVLNLSRPNR